MVASEIQPKSRPGVVIVSDDQPETTLRSPMHNSPLKRSISVFAHAFSLGYGLRSAVSICSRMLNLLKSSPQQLLSLEAVIGEKHLVMREEAVRLGLFAGSFAGGFEFLMFLFRYIRKKDDEWNIIYSGALAGFSLVFQSSKNRRMIALYAFVRMCECLYRNMKNKGRLKPIRGGAAALFAISSAQIMYAYTMRPDTLAPSFYHFIQNTGPVAMPVLKAVRCSYRKSPVNELQLKKYLLSTSAGEENIDRLIESVKNGLIPCSVLHPGTSSCINQVVHAMFHSAQKIFPLYASLTISPVLFLKFGAFLRNPVHYVSAMLKTLLRSVLFMCSFVGLYQGACCLYQRGIEAAWYRPHRIIFYLAGLVASLSVFIERPAKQSELALYTLPRGADTLFTLLVDRRLLSGVPFGDLILFSLSVSVIMFFREYEPDAVPPIISRILQFLFKEDNLGIVRSRSFFSS